MKTDLARPGGLERPQGFGPEPVTRDLRRAVGILRAREVVPAANAHLVELVGPVDDGECRLSLHRDRVQLSIRAHELLLVVESWNALEERRHPRIVAGRRWIVEAS